MRFRFSILPDASEGQELRTGGPYRFVRHPMYTAVLLAAMSLVSHRPDFASAIAWVLLLAVLLAKINIEEAQLLKKFSEYRAYQERTKKLIPWIH